MTTQDVYVADQLAVVELEKLFARLDKLMVFFGVISRRPRPACAPPTKLLSPENAASEFGMGRNVYMSRALLDIERNKGSDSDEEDEAQARTRTSKVRTSFRLRAASFVYRRGWHLVVSLLFLVNLIKFLIFTIRGAEATPLTLCLVYLLWFAFVTFAQIILSWKFTEGDLRLLVCMFKYTSLNAANVAKRLRKLALGCLIAIIINIAIVMGAAWGDHILAHKEASTRTLLNAVSCHLFQPLPPNGQKYSGTCPETYNRDVAIYVVLHIWISVNWIFPLVLYIVSSNIVVREFQNSLKYTYAARRWNSTLAHTSSKSIVRELQEGYAQMVDKFNSLARKFNPWLLALFATKLPLIIILSYQLLLSTRRGDSAFSIMAYSIWLAAGTGYLFLAALFAGNVNASTRTVLLQLLNPRTQELLAEWSEAELKRSELFRKQMASGKSGRSVGSIAKGSRSKLLHFANLFSGSKLARSVSPMPLSIAHALTADAAEARSEVPPVTEGATASRYAPDPHSEVEGGPPPHEDHHPHDFDALAPTDTGADRPSASAAQRGEAEASTPPTPPPPPPLPPGKKRVALVVEEAMEQAGLTISNIREMSTTGKKAAKSRRSSNSTQARARHVTTGGFDDPSTTAEKSRLLLMESELELIALKDFIQETSLGYRLGYLLITHDLMGSIASIIISYLVLVATL